MSSPLAGGIFSGLGRGINALVALRLAQADQAAKEKDAQDTRDWRQRMYDQQEAMRREALAQSGAEHATAAAESHQRTNEALMERRRNDVLARLPHGYTMDPETVNAVLQAQTAPATNAASGAMNAVNAATGGFGSQPTTAPTNVDLGARLQAAFRAAGHGLNAHPGTSQGVTYTPQEPGVSVSYSPDRQTRGAGNPQLRAAASTAFQMLDRMDAATHDDSEADTNPALASLAEGVGNASIVGKLFHGMTEPAAQGIRSSAQNRFRNAQTILAHTYPSLLLHARNGPQMVLMMGDALGQMSSTADPASRAEKRQIVRGIMNEYWRDMFNEDPPTPGSTIQGTTANDLLGGGVSQQSQSAVDRYRLRARGTP